MKNKELRVYRPLVSIYIIPDIVFSRSQDKSYGSAPAAGQEDDYSLPLLWF
jgi:hypothetical protein